MVRLIIGLIRDWRKQKQLEFKTEVLEAIMMLDLRDKQLLCRAFGLPVDMNGIHAIASMNRKELAKQCAQYYVRFADKKWKVLPAFRDVLYNIRRGK
ncbi:hypothetical protein pEaSNUABM40_00270 [Erwinia phage pEa_SNUABM_40]|nr:hypothetical protein pEaSNUABM40_00270 [Erwinia phage pEa_SNUABM_40]UAW53047.1 hypothetical protein pEaSNUABM23_00265 [Erwinia phage pEa_SNUABM_23]UIW10942.1 hypothetical protein pEaSNUABM23_00265 [Erwinia phage pEa_SNUABM_31]